MSRLSGRRKKGPPGEADLSASELVEKIIKRRVDELTRLVWKAHPANAYLRSMPPPDGSWRIRPSSWEDINRPVRRKVKLLFLVEALCEYVIPALVQNYPSVTRMDFVALLADTWPASRGTRSTRMFDSRLVQAAHAALIRENPSWGSRAATETLADRLMVTSRTIQAHLRMGVRKKR